MSETANQPIQPANRPIQDLTIWIVALGGLLILLGFGAITVPFLMPEAVTLALAWVFSHWWVPPHCLRISISPKSRILA